MGGKVCPEWGLFRSPVGGWSFIGSVSGIKLSALSEEDGPSSRVSLGQNEVLCPMSCG